MKKFLLVLSAVAATVQFANAQCTPDPQFTAPGFYPDSLTGLTDACVDINYDQTITVVGIADTVIGGFTIAVDSITIDNVTGLPGAMTYSVGASGSDNVIFPSVDPASCINLTGTPVVGDLGPHALVIMYTVHVTVLGQVQSVPLAQGYTLNVVTCSAGLEEQSVNTNKTLLKVTDLMGRETTPTPNTPLLYHYSDGTIVRQVNLK